MREFQVTFHEDDQTDDKEFNHYLCADTYEDAEKKAKIEYPNDVIKRIIELSPGTINTVNSMIK